MKQNYDDMMIFQDMISHDLRTITYAKMLTAYCTRPETKKIKKIKQHNWNKCSEYRKSCPNH